MGHGFSSSVGKQQHMFLSIFKGLLTAICLSLAMLILIAAPLGLGTIAFACFLVFCWC